MTALTAVMDAIADQIRTQLAGSNPPAIDGLQVEPRMVVVPAATCIDVYPASPFQEQVAYGMENREVFVTVRARLTTADDYGAQDLLLDMLDPASDASVLAAIAANLTLSGKVDYVLPRDDTPSGFQIYEDAGGNGAYLGCQWDLKVGL